MFEGILGWTLEPAFQASMCDFANLLCHFVIIEDESYVECKCSHESCSEVPFQVELYHAPLLGKQCSRVASIVLDWSAEAIDLAGYTQRIVLDWYAQAVHRSGYMRGIMLGWSAQAVVVAGYTESRRNALIDLRIVVQVDAAADMIEQLLVPTDEARNEHKRLQLRELAALNGTLKDDQHCYICGESGHRQFECPTKADEVYQLPTAIQAKVDDLYQRDIQRMHGDGAAPGKACQSFWTRSARFEMGIKSSLSDQGETGIPDLKWPIDSQKQLQTYFFLSSTFVTSFERKCHCTCLKVLYDRYGWVG
jgi:hypothetical protein